jgi:anti-sigma factor RsiW
MKEPKDFYNDPRLTAYALGELEGEERAAVEAALQTDAAARAAVDEIRATARQLEAALAAEPMPEFQAITAPLEQRAAIIPGRDPRKLDGGPGRNLIRFPQAYYLVAGLAAACFAVMVTLHESEVGEQRKAAIEAMQMPEDARKRGAMKSADAAEAKPSPYTQVTFPAPSIPAGRVELQAEAREMAEADNKNALAGSIAANQPADVETVKLPSFDGSAAPAHGYSAPETVSGTRGATDIAGVNNSVAYAFPSRDTVKETDGISFAAPTGGAPRDSAGITYGAFDSGQARLDAGGAIAKDEKPQYHVIDYDYHADRDFLSVAQNPLSTFALDVGTSSYANVRRFLRAGERPPADAVCIEELVNYFPYAYAAPHDNAPLAATLEVAAAPWAPAHRLVRIGLKAREVTAAARPAANPAGGALVTVAKDVKAQVEFNPAKVQSYRLIGYDGRALKKEDFDNNAITAGDVGAGHTVTALYEIVPAGVAPPATPGVDALKYQEPEGRSQMTNDRDQKAGSVISNSELLTVKVRYTPPEGGASRQMEFPLTDRGAAFAEASMDFKFAAAVAGFGMILRESPFKGNATLAGVEQWAGQGLGPDAGGYRAEFIGLVHQAEKLKE